MLLIAILAPIATVMAQSDDLALSDSEFIASDPLLSASTPVPAEELRLMTARRMARAGLLFIRSTTEPRFPEYRAASLILREAHQLAPNDPDILRLYIESLHATGDSEEELRLSSRLFELEPDDHVLLLRIITARINRLQTVEQRLGLYERLLGAGGSQLDPEIRSRLAFDAAILAREFGLDDRFVEFLTLATQLDITNKTAAAMAASYFLEQTSDPLGRVELLVNVVLSDPVDPTAMITLARELLSHGAMTGARRFYENASYVLAAIGVDTDESVRNEYFLTLWDTDGGAELLRQFKEQEVVQKYTIEQMKLQAEADGGDPSDIQEWLPDLAQTRFRIAIASALGLDEDLYAAFEHLETATNDALAGIEEARVAINEGVEKGDFEVDAAENTLEELDGLVQKTELEQLWLRTWAGVGLEEAKASFEILQEDMTETARRRFEGILAIHEGRIDEGRAILTEIVKEDARALVGLGLAFELEGDLRGATSYYARAALEQPGTVVSEWSKTVIERLRGEELEPSPLARALEEYVENIPGSLDDVSRQPRSFVYLEVEPDAVRRGPLDQSFVTLTLRNVHRTLPLAVGERSPLNSSIMLTPRVDVRGELFQERVRSEIVRMDRRLRLLPGESLSMRIWTGRGESGLVLDDLAAHRVGLRWRAIQGFRLRPETESVSEHYAPGPLCIDAVSERQTRVPTDGVASDMDVVKRRITLGSGRALLETLVVARSLLIPIKRLTGSEAVRFQERIAEVAQLVADRLPTLSPMERAVTLLLMPPARASQEFLPVDEIALADSDRLVRFITLFSRTETHDDELVTTSLQSEDPAIREMAELLYELRAPSEPEDDVAAADE